MNSELTKFDFNLYSNFFEYKDIICIGLIINIGFINDDNIIGLAHFLEHMLIEPFRQDANVHDISLIRGTTNIQATTYEIFIKNSSNHMKHALEIISKIANGLPLSESFFDAVKNDVLKEIIREKEQGQEKLSIHLFGCSALGNAETINRITYSDVFAFFINNYASSHKTIYYLGNKIEEFKDTISELRKSKKQTPTESSIHFQVNEPLICQGNSIFIQLENASGNLRERVIEDMILLIIENSQVFGENHIVSIEKIYFTSKIRFAHILLDQIKCTDGIQNNNFVENLCFETMARFKEILPLYIECIKDHRCIEISKWSEEIKNYILFNVKSYSKDEYIDILKSLKPDQIISAIRNLYLEIEK